MAIKVLLEKGVPEEAIVFTTLITCREGLENIITAYPKIQIVTAEIDPSLDKRKYIVPGIGGRYFSKAMLFFLFHTLTT